MSRQAAIANAHDAGHRAGQKGLPQRHNPHPDRTALWRAWLNGYRQGQKARKGGKR